MQIDTCRIYSANFKKDILDIKKRIFMQGFENIKLVALDMDDTVLTHDKKVSKRTQKVLKTLANQGIYIVVATGRPPQGIFDYVKDLNLITDKGYVVCFNGAGIAHLPDLKMVYSEYLTGKKVKEISSLCHQYGCKVHGYSKDKGLLLEDENSPSYREVTHCKVGYIKQDLTTIDDDMLFYKMLAVGSKEDLDALREKLLDHSSLSGFTIMRSDPNFLEFIPGTCTKGSALVELCKILHISIDNVIAFGDAENDKVMIEKAGIGVAMGNAYECVKDFADIIADTNDNDGVAKVLEQVFNLKS